MKAYRGSFTIEAGYIMPLVLLCLCIAIETGISLYEEVREQVAAQMKQEPLDLVDSMYRRDYVKELFGELYED